MALLCFGIRTCQRDQVGRKKKWPKSFAKSPKIEFDSKTEVWAVQICFKRFSSSAKYQSWFWSAIHKIRQIVWGKPYPNIFTSVRVTLELQIIQKMTLSTFNCILSVFYSSKYSVISWIVLFFLLINIEPKKLPKSQSLPEPSDRTAIA